MILLSGSEALGVIRPVGPARSFIEAHGGHIFALDPLVLRQGLPERTFLPDGTKLVVCQHAAVLPYVAKAHPGRINMASAGIGTIFPMAGELFNMMTGIALTHVPHRGAAPAVTDLLGGPVQAMFDNAASSTAHIRAGRLRALAVTTATRMDALSDVPTVAEFVQGYEANAWRKIRRPAWRSAY